MLAFSLARNAINMEILGHSLLFSITLSSFLPFQKSQRIFDPATYYYLKPETTSFDAEMQERLLKFEYNVLLNSKLLDREFSVQAEIFLEKGDLEKYIAEKQMIKEYKGGELGRILFKKDKKIVEWF